MSPKKQVQLSSLCLGVMILLIFIYGVVIFYLPNLLGYYAETGQALSPMLRFVLEICYLINEAEIVLIPALILGFVFALIWRIQSSIKYRKDNNLIPKVVLNDHESI